MVDIMEPYMMGVGFLCVILVGFITLSFVPRVLRSNQVGCCCKCKLQVSLQELIVTISA